jgi:hypothetical protein
MSPRNRCAKIVRECEQLIRDVASWNENRPDAPPMDDEPERLLLPVARRCLKAWDAGDTLLAQALSEQMVNLMQA